MIGVRVVAAVATAAASVFTVTDPAEAGGADDLPFLLFAGTDLWRYGAFLYGGTLWSPAGFDTGGFTLKMLLNGGGYTYNSGTLNTDVQGTMLSAAAMPGWRFTRDALSVSVFFGPTVQDYRLTPYDPGSRLHGLYAGAQFAGDVWYQPTPSTMVSVGGNIISIGPTGSLRTAFGFRVFDLAFIGPETQELWCGNFEQVQLGAHVTGFRTDKVEWSAGTGWSMTSDRRTGPYLRAGFNVRY